MEKHEETSLAMVDEAGITRAGINQTIAELALLDEFVKTVMVKGQDYGTVPGIDKPFLWKAGADNIIAAMRCHSESRQTDGTINPATGFVIYEHEAVIKRNVSGMVIAQGVGCCTNQETKYRWRDAQRLCPECQAPAIIKGKAEYGGGWLCWNKRGGCGFKFMDGDPTIEDQPLGRVENPDPLDQTNTIMKMSEKRAVVDATLKLPGVARFFSQDFEIQSGEPTPEGPESAAQPSAKASQGKAGKKTSDAVCAEHSVQFAKGHHPLHDEEGKLTGWCQENPDVN